MTEAQQLTQGRWQGILAELGVPSESLTGKHGPCPACGGRDRFRWDNKDGNGTYYCNGCGAGDGFDLLAKVKGWDFGQVLREVKRVLHFCPAKPAQTRNGGERKWLRRVMRGARYPQADGPVALYLGKRGVAPCVSLLEHPRMANGKPAMLAVVSDPKGEAVTLHRTYLTRDGRKASGVCRKLGPCVPGTTVTGGAIRLFDADDTLGVAEGIETALAVHQMFELPVWATVNAHGMESLKLPKSIERVWIYGDKDASYTGQKAAYALANRLAVREGREVHVAIPPHEGDWNDVLMEGKRTA